MEEKLAELNIAEDKERGFERLKYQSGFGNHFSSEAKPGALPVGQNNPLKCPYGLYAEQVSGTAFTVPRKLNQRSWLYRIKPSVTHEPFHPRVPSHDRLVSEFNESTSSATPTQLRWRPVSIPDNRTNFVDGLFTICGAGSSFLRHGYAVHISSADARYIASLVPLVNCARLLIHGFSIVTNEGLVKSVSREGKPEELLRGPMYYVMVLIVCTTVFWRDSPIGMISLAMMCGGDGIADIMGRRFGGLKLPYNSRKSWAGSISMFVFGFLVSLGFLSYFAAFGFIQLDWENAVQKVAIISIVATIVESLPVTEFLDDNFSVPLTSILLGLWLFPN